MLVGFKGITSPLFFIFFTKSIDSVLLTWYNVSIVREGVNKLAKPKLRTKCPHCGKPIDKNAAVVGFEKGKAIIKCEGCSKKFTRES